MMRCARLPPRPAPLHSATLADSTRPLVLPASEVPWASPPGHGPLYFSSTVQSQSGRCLVEPDAAAGLLQRAIPRFCSTAKHTRHTHVAFEVHEQLVSSRLARGGHTSPAKREQIQILIPGEAHRGSRGFWLRRFGFGIGEGLGFTCPWRR